MIEFSNQLTQNNWYLILATKILVTIPLDSKLVSNNKLETNLESNSISG